VLILCGFFCAGKTTAGRLCAEKHSLPFYDTDRLIEAHYGQKSRVGEIWQKIGESAFRDLETKVILSLKKEDALVATGGGALLQEENRSYLKELGTSIYLKAPLLVLYQRALQRGLPSFLNRLNPYAHFEELARNRFPIYEKHCQYRIETENVTDIELADKIGEAIALGRFFK
jgi:shikimate kinase